MMNVSLVWRMMVRDFRAGELHLLGLAIVIAVACLTSVGFLSDRVSRGLDREANQVLGGDLLLRADQPWEDAPLAEARQRGLALTETVLFRSMLGTAEKVELAGVKAVGEGYPLRGAVRIAPGPGAADAEAEDIPAPGEIWLDERLFARLGVGVGDQVELGERSLRVAAMVTFESERGANFFSLLPQALCNLNDLDSTGLILPGSRATWRLHFAGGVQQIEDFKAWIEPRLGRGEALETVDETRPGMTSSLDQTQRFLRLAALLAVILAAVAVGLSSRRFLRRHLDACAIMCCFGASRRRVVMAFIGEFALFGLLVALAGGVLGWGAQTLLANGVECLVEVELPATSPWPLVYGVVVGFMLLIGFVLPQLLQLRHVSTLRVLRRELGAVEPASGVAWLAGVATLAGLTVWVAGDLRLGSLVMTGFAGAFGVFALCAWMVFGLLGKLREQGCLRGGGWRYGMAALSRRTGNSVLQVSALGMGITALLLLTLVRGDLIDTWQNKTPVDAPNRFVLNIQPAQQAEVLKHFDAADLPRPGIEPMVRGRLVAINGETVDAEHYQNRRAQRLAEREFNLSYGSDLSTGVEVVAGKWHGETTEPQFSVEQGLAQQLDMQLGDVLTFNVAGREVEAPITSLRALEWDSMRVNFFVVAAPGMLDEAPESLITSFHLPPDASHEFTTSLVRSFPNLSVIDVSALLAQIEGMADKLSLIVQFVFGFALAAGLVVLYAALAATHDERSFELSVLRTLGARDRQLRHALLAEFAVLGAIAGGLAAIAAGSIGGLLAWLVFDMTYVPNPLFMATAVAVSLTDVVVAGWFGTRGLLSAPPLTGLRSGYAEA